MAEVQQEQDRLSSTLDKLFEAVRELEELYPGRRFTPDGHLVGSLGEVLAKAAFGVELLPHSTKGRDAQKGDLWIEIKSTFSKSVRFRSHDSHDDKGRCLVLKLGRSKPYFEKIVYNGPIKPILNQLAQRRPATNGQTSITLKQLEELDALVADEDRLHR